MKKKKLKKLAKFIHKLQLEEKELKSKWVTKDDGIYAKSPEPEPDRTHQCECDPEVVNKMFTLITGLIRFKDKINFNINDDSIVIYGNLEQFKTTKNNIEDYIEITVNKEGFRVSRRYSNLRFKEPNLFDKLLPILMDLNQSVSGMLLEEMVDDVMVITKLSRDSNLEELLK